MIPFSPPYISQDAIDEVVDTLKSGWITTGPKTKRFEQMLVDYTGTKRVLCVNSATFGMELMLRWYGIEAGDEVIIPAYTYCATANVVMHLGAKPVMVDINRDDFNISVSEIKAAITSKTKAIIAVDLGGVPCDYDAIYSVVKDREVSALFEANSEPQSMLNRILVMSDAAHSLGATYNGQNSGTFSDITVFSFHAVKNLTTAEGGAIALNLPEPFEIEALYRYLNAFSLHGQSKDALAKTQANAWKYDVIVPGYKGNMTDIQASLGLSQLKEYPKILERRKQIFEYYSAQLSGCSWAELPLYQSDNRSSSYHLYLLRLRGVSELQRDEIMQRIFSEGVSVNVHYQPLPALTAYTDFATRPLPVSFDSSAREITLPVFYTLSDSDMKRVIEVVIAACNAILKK